MRKKIVAGNWKMNLNLEQGEELVNDINSMLKKGIEQDVRVIICSPFIHLDRLSAYTKEGKISIGAQNCSTEESGAYTGEISAQMIRSTGAEYVIIGHSERRSYYKEDNEILAKKVGQSLDKGLQVIFCCGEVLSERESGNHFEVVREQLYKGIFNLPDEDFKKIIIAYEPVWAIGTGVTASTAQAQEMHEYIRSLIKEKYGSERAEDTSILYGGSCKPNNASELFSMKDVDGGLIGGASLKAVDFVAIINSY